MLQYSYAYDDLGQLTRENNLPANRTYLYSYDKDGNMLSKTECYYSLAVATPIGTTSFTYDGTKSDCLTKITFPGGKVFSTYYGSTGNPAHIITENGDTMAAMWSMGRRLTTIAAGLNTFYYRYNADGIRTGKTINGVKHTYALSGTTILNEEWTENGVQHLLMYVYDANGSPVGMVYRNSTMAADATEEYLFVKNIQGDILHVYNSTGNKLVSYVYDAWGNIISTTYSNGGGTSAARFNPFTYRGYGGVNLMKKSILSIMILIISLSSCTRYSAYKFREPIEDVVLIQIIQSDDADRVLFETEDRTILYELQKLKCRQRWSDPANAIKGITIRVYYKSGSYELICRGCSAYFNGKRLRYNRDYFDVEEYENFISGYIPEQSGNESGN